MIYFVEDDASIRELVLYTLNNAGFQAEGFERPSAFWKAVGQMRPTLILLDIMLPEEDGLSILRKLRADPDTRATPVMMLTAKGTEYDTVLALVVLYETSANVTADMMDGFLNMMSQAGKLFHLEESLMDVGAAVSGCGPAYAYLILDAMADGGVACGLPRPDAVRFAAQTLLGAAQMVLETGKHPDQLKNDVCSPGGSTIQGGRTLEQRAVRAAVMDAVIAACEKNAALGK